MWVTNIFLFANLKRGFYHFGDSCSNVLKNEYHCSTSLGNKCERRTFSCSRVGSFWRCIFIYPQYCTISSSDNVLNKINIISAAAGLWGINVSDEYFLVRGRVIFGDVFIFIPNIAQFSFVRKEKQKGKQTNS